MKKEVTSIRLPPPLLERVREEATSLDITPAEFIRRAIERELRYCETTRDGGPLAALYAAYRAEPTEGIRQLIETAERLRDEAR